ncbi:MAG: hypothetical protein WD010_02320 [Nitriliruptor sp.]|uniref:hypothetical protein n=1 Tax=Nitriliruptor sp. TaxID=2448056 RepID=UPI00349FE7A9
MITTRGVLTVTAAATLAAGFIGVVRQRTEMTRVRRGDLAPASAASVVDPLREPGRVGGALAAWRPQRPTTVIGRFAAALWASPLTTAGVVLGLLGGAVPRWDPVHGCLVAAGVRGPSGAALAMVGADANTIGQVVLARHGQPSAALLSHEVAHVRQSERLGPFLLPAYVWLSARYGYRDHPLERAARDVARGYPSKP